MKLRSCLTLSVIFLALFANAQLPNAVIRGGVNFSRVSITNGGRFDEANILTSYQFGLMLDLHLASIVYLQPGINYTGKGAKIEKGDQDASLTWYKATSNPFYIELPFNLVLKSPGKLKMFGGAGPYVAFGVGGKNKVEGKLDNVFFKSEDNIKFTDEEQGSTLSFQDRAGFAQMKRVDYGFNMLAGVECHRVIFAAQYGYGLAKLTAGNDDDKNKSRVLSFTLGLKL